MSNLNYTKMKISLIEKIKHLGKRYYRGPIIRWLIVDKDNKSVNCYRCGNIANCLITGKVIGFRFRIPVCKKHLKQHHEN